MFPHSTLLSKPSCHSMPQEEPQVSLLTQEMVSPTLFPSMKDMHFHTPFSESIWQEEPVPTGWSKSSPNSEPPSPHQQKEKSLETSKRSSLMLLLTMRQNCKNIRTLLPTISHSNSQTETLSPFKIKDSDAPNYCSNPPSSVWRFQGSTNSPSNQS